MKSLSRILVFLIFGVIIVVLILLGGGFLGGEKIQPGKVKSEKEAAVEPGRTASASMQTIIEWFEAVGTIRPRTETNIEAQVTGRVVEVLVRSGQKVTPGQDLIVLDSREFGARLDQAEQGLKSAQARLEQAGQAVIAAKAELDRASAEFNRFSRLYKSGTISSRELEGVQAKYVQAQAGLNQAYDAKAEAQAGVAGAEKQVEEARIASTYTTISALHDAQVVKRLAEPGDLAWPGKQLLVLQTGEVLRLEAFIREGLIEKARPGAELKVAVDSINRVLDGRVEELVPSADPMTRTFLVKVAVEKEPGLYPGMFGRLLVPMDARKVVTVPVGAVRRVGQLETVLVKTGNGWSERFVRSGQVLETNVEILSGLDAGEVVAVWEAE